MDNNKISKVKLDTFGIGLTEVINELIKVRRNSQQRNTKKFTNSIGIHG